MDEKKVRYIGEAAPPGDRRSASAYLRGLADQIDAGDVHALGVVWVGKGKGDGAGGNYLDFIDSNVWAGMCLLGLTSDLQHRMIVYMEGHAEGEGSDGDDGKDGGRD